MADGTGVIALSKGVFENYQKLYKILKFVDF
jgi:hypothetical protein